MDKCFAVERTDRMSGGGGRRKGEEGRTHKHTKCRGGMLLVWETVWETLWSLLRDDVGLHPQWSQ